MIMKTGIQKRQWVILFFVLSLPLMLNGVAIWLKIGTTGTLQLLSGTYHPSNPNLPSASLWEILLQLLPIILFLGLFCWLAIFVSNRAFFQKQSLTIKIVESLLQVLLIAKVFEIAAGVIMPLVWLPQFNDYSLGLPGSDFTANWSHWFIFPATAIILFAALMSSRNKSLEDKKKVKPLMPYKQKRG
jgi:hypothetical protein